MRCRPIANARRVLHPVVVAKGTPIAASANLDNVHVANSNVFVARVGTHRDQNVAQDVVELTLYGRRYRRLEFETLANVRHPGVRVVRERFGSRAVFRPLMPNRACVRQGGWNWARFNGPARLLRTRRCERR